MKILIIVISFIITGCTVSKLPPNLKRMEVGKLRHQLYTECLELTAKIERKGDDDVSNIVDSCDSIAYYQAKQILDY